MGAMRVLQISDIPASSFLQRIREVQFADPLSLLPAIEEAQVWLLPGVLEWNVARFLGTSISRVRTLRAQCPDFNEALAAMESARAAHAMQLLEEGAIPAKVADRIVYANTREAVEAPKLLAVKAEQQIDQTKLIAIQDV
jgi:hypothetical protein